MLIPLPPLTHLHLPADSPHLLCRTAELGTPCSFGSVAADLVGTAGATGLGDKCAGTGNVYYCTVFGAPSAPNVSSMSTNGNCYASPQHVVSYTSCSDASQARRSASHAQAAPPPAPQFP